MLPTMEAYKYLILERSAKWDLIETRGCHDKVRWRRCIWKVEQNDERRKIQFRRHRRVKKNDMRRLKHETLRWGTELPPITSVSLKTKKPLGQLIRQVKWHAWPICRIQPLVIWTNVTMGCEGAAKEANESLNRAVKTAKMKVNESQKPLFSVKHDRDLSVVNIFR